MTLISRSGLGVSKATVLWLCSSILWTACKKPPETAVPVQVQTTVETPEKEVEEPAQTDVDSTDGNLQSEEVVEETEGSEGAEGVEFADAVNNAVALLTGDEVAVQKGLEALEGLAKSSDGGSPEIAYNIGVAHLKLGNERAARKSFEEAVELDPTFAKGWYNLGVLLERNRKYDDAIALYEEGLLHSETDPTLSAGKISCLRKSGRLDESIAYAQQVLSKNANNVDAYSEVGMVLLQQGNLDKALFVLQQASAKNGSENARLQSVLGQVYYAQEKIPLAEVAFKKSLALDPTLIETSMYLSFLQLENRAWTKANDTLAAALKLEPTNAALLNAMGIAQRGLGNIEEAERLYKEAYQLNPSNPEPLLNMAVLEADYKEGNNYAKAYDLLDRYLDEGGTKEAIVKEWRSEIEASEAAYLEQKKKEELRALFKRRREEAARKRAEEEAKRAAEEAAQEDNAEAAEEAEGADEQTDGEDEDSSEGSTEDTGDNASDGEGLNEETENSESTDDSVENEEAEESEDAEGAEGAEGPTENGTQETNDVNSQTDADEGSAVEVEEAAQGDNGWDAAVDVDSASEIGTEEQADSESSDSENTENDDSNQASDVQDALPVDEENDSEEAVSSEVDDGGESSELVETIEEPETTEEASTDEQTVEVDNGWGVVQTPTCEVQSDCPSDLICASNKECLTDGEFGTLQVGEACNATDECAVSLECIEQVCATDSTGSAE